MRSSALLDSWRGTYTTPTPCTTQPPPSACANPWRALLTWDDAVVAVLTLITQLPPGIAGMQQSGGQLLQRKKTRLCIGMCSGAGQGQLHHTPKGRGLEGQCSQAGKHS